MRLLSLLLVIAATVRADNVCDTQLVGEHTHFTRIDDQNKSRECWFEVPDSADVFLDIERYSDRKTVDMDARLNFTFGDTTVSIHNAYIQVGQHRCAVPMQTKLEQTIWIWLHFVDNTMTLQVSPANTAFFGHCLQLFGVEKTVGMHAVGWTSSGMEQVLRGVHADRPSLEDPGQTVVMRKTIHELERRIHRLEEKHEELTRYAVKAHRHHTSKHEDHRTSRSKHQQSVDGKVQEMHQALENVTDRYARQKRDILQNPWFNCACIFVVVALICIVYRLWVLGSTQQKLSRFKL